MRSIYYVYVPETIIKAGVEYNLKKEFDQYFGKKEAEEYKKRLEKRYPNVMLEEKQLKNNPYA